MELEARLQQIEHKYALGEQNLNQVVVKGETGISYVTEWNEKLDKRVMQIESNMIGLGKEQLKDRDTIGRLEVINQKITDDLRGLLSTMQNDYQNKLESRVTELVNRIVLEHEERKRADDDMKH